MKRILFVISEYGYWGEELVGPKEVLENAGFIIDYATHHGKRPHALPPSMDSSYIDPPLGRSVVSTEMAEKVCALENSDELDHPISLCGLFSQNRPYISSPSYLRELEKYNASREAAAMTCSVYDALVLVGGSGPIVDMVNNVRVHDLIRIFYDAGKPIAAECYGVACLAFARDYWNRKSLLWGKHVTGHPLEYDYLDGTGFYGVDFNMGPPPYPLEYILRDATGADGGFHGNVGSPVSTLVDYPFITGRSTADSYKTGELLVNVLQDGLKRYGW